MGSGIYRMTGLFFASFAPSLPPQVLPFSSAVKRKLARNHRESYCSALTRVSVAVEAAAKTYSHPGSQAEPAMAKSSRNHGHVGSISIGRIDANTAGRPQIWLLRNFGVQHLEALRSSGRQLPVVNQIVAGLQEPAYVSIAHVLRVMSYLKSKLQEMHPMVYQERKPVLEPGTQSSFETA